MLYEVSHYMFKMSSGFARICCEEGQSWKLGHGSLMANYSFCD